MTGPALSQIDRVFQGMVPSILATCSADGIPNISGISHVYRIDDEYIAISEQFMRRSRENLEQTGIGQLNVVDPATGDQYALSLQFVRRETEGQTVTRIRTRVEGIAAATGMAGVFAVRAAIVCRVTEVKPVAVHRAIAASGPTAKPPGLAHLSQLAEQLHSTGDLGTLAAALLRELDEAFGFRHSVLLLADETREKLFTLESRGFPASGVGSEVRVGEGLLGQCAQSRLPLRLSSLTRERMYIRAISASVDEIPLPGLPNAESLLAVPMASRDELVGLLVLQSPQTMAFSHDDEIALSIVARLAAPQLARARADVPEDAPVVSPPAAPPSTQTPIAIRYFEENDSVFVNSEYLVKGVAGRILWTILNDRVERDRSEFTNRELRLDPRLGLSAFNDNLEARMLLLRRRLEESGLPLRLPVTGRGRFRFECDQPLSLEKVATGRV